MKVRTITHYNPDLVVKAIKLATTGHIESNHRYGDFSYVVHLAHVVDVLYRYIDLVPVQSRPDVIAAGWLHDSIEDARLSYNDVKKGTNKNVAEMVRAVTNYTRGRNRMERMPDFVYEDIRNTDGATFLKLGDRIANIESGGKSEMYKKEQPHFKELLYNAQYDVMFDYIETLFLE